MLRLPSAYVGLMGFWLSLLGFWMLASSASASEPIYQVEMIVFERTAPGSDEVWPKNLSLEYPKPWQRLFNPLEEAQQQKAAAQADALRLSDDFLRTLAQESAELQSGADATQSSTDSAPRTQTSDATSATQPPSLPEFFAFLPKERRGLQQSRDAIDRNHQLRVVFHEAWRQPLTAIEKSPALLLRGGNRYGDHYELQGYLYLGISRFLHLHTNLWFTHFAPNHGQLPEHWPILPVEPMGLASRSDMSGSDTSMRASDSSASSSDLPSQTWATDEMDSAFTDLKESPYVINQIVTLQQKRRLRSGELHYIDHPKLGMLIKITPEK